MSVREAPGRPLPAGVVGHSGCQVRMWLQAAERLLSAVRLQVAERLQSAERLQAAERQQTAETAADGRNGCLGTDQ